MLKLSDSLEFGQEYDQTHTTQDDMVAAIAARSHQTALRATALIDDENVSVLSLFDTAA